MSLKKKNIQNTFVMSLYLVLSFALVLFSPYFFASFLPLPYTIPLPNERKATSFAKTKGASAAARVQGGTRFSRGHERTVRKEKNVLPQNKNKTRSKWRIVVSEALASDNEQSDDEE